MSNQSRMEELQKEWDRLRAARPKEPGRKPTKEEMVTLVAYKDRVRIFMGSLSPEEAMHFPATKLKPTKQRKPKNVVQTKQGTPKGPQRVAKQEKVSLGWHAKNKESFVFTNVIPFNSHRKRRAYEREEDENVFGGINRCVFPNLFVDSKPLHIPNPDPELLGHGAKYTHALCAESFYMAAKAKYACDARFIMEELTEDSLQVANFGHNKLELTTSQKKHLIELGANPEDFESIAEIDPDSSETYIRWLRGKDGVMPVRDGWHDIRHNVFLYILRHKFGLYGTESCQAGTEARQTTDALVHLIQKGEFPIMVEARRADSFWGEGEEGAGFNCLGRTISQVMLEAAGKSSTAPNLSLEEAKATLLKPNTELIDYVERT